MGYHTSPITHRTVKIKSISLIPILLFWFVNAYGQTFSFGQGPTTMTVGVPVSIVDTLRFTGSSDTMSDVWIRPALPNHMQWSFFAVTDVRIANRQLYLLNAGTNADTTRTWDTNIAVWGAIGDSLLIRVSALCAGTSLSITISGIPPTIASTDSLTTYVIDNHGTRRFTIRIATHYVSETVPQTIRLYKSGVGPDILSIAGAHEIACQMVIKRPQNHQNPQIEKLRSVPYFPFCVKA